MKALSVQPTIEAYNAPLRWVGGLAASLSRPYSECAPWDSYETDFQKGFIKAEVLSYVDFIDCAGLQNAKTQGKVRLEGKEYLMNDGDIVHFKFNV